MGRKAAVGCDAAESGLEYLDARLKAAGETSLGVWKLASSMN
jgi:hypothetical protein